MKGRVGNGSAFFLRVFISIIAEVQYRFGLNLEKVIRPFEDFRSSGLAERAEFSKLSH
jgi:hypothetical protein